MKAKTILLGGALLCSAVAAFGQVKVDKDGNLTVKNSVLGISSFGARNNDRAHLYINTKNTSGGYTRYGVYSRIASANSMPEGDCIGIYGAAYNDGAGIPERYVGVYGSASSYNGPVLAKLTVGVAGIAGTNANSVGVYGGIHSLPSSLTITSTIYAGYFAGAVNITGNVSAANLTTSSDERLKRNVEAVGSKRNMEKLLQLKPVAYNLRQVDVEHDSTDAKGEKHTFFVNRYDEKSQLFQKKHYGLLAQELQKVYPDLVYEGGDGYLEINYIGLIPLLLQAVQEQQATISKQQKAIEELQKRLPAYDVATPIADGKETDAKRMILTK